MRCWSLMSLFVRRVGCQMRKLIKQLPYLRLRLGALRRILPILVLVCGTLFLAYGNSDLIRGSLEGAESAAVAMLLALTIRLASKGLRDRLDWSLAVVMLLCVGAMNWPLWLCLPVATAIGIGCRQRLDQS